MFSFKPTQVTFKPLLTGLLSIFFTLFHTGTFAQDGIFADDFSSDSIRFSSGSFNGSNSDYSITPAADGLLLTTTADEPGETGSAYIIVQDSADKFGMDITHLSTSVIANETYVNAFLEASLYSDMPDSANNNGEGTVTSSITFGYGADRQLGAFTCMNRREANGGSVQLPDTCGPIEGIAPSFDQRYALDISMDREANQITFSVNDASKTIAIPETLYPADQEFRRIQLYSDNGNGTANATVHAVRLGDELVDMVSNPPIVDRYNPFTHTGSTFKIVDQKLTVKGVSLIESDRSTSADLNLSRITDHLEAELILSSESDVSIVASQIQARLQGRFYNDTADGGVDGSLGDIDAVVSLTAGGDGLRRVEFCLQRFDDAEGNSRTGLIDADDAGQRCEELPIRVEFDKAYRASMSLDRSASTFVFRLNGLTRTYAVGSSFFVAANPASRVAIEARRGATAIGTIDNVRTAPEALLASEQAAGLTTAASFPEPTSDAELMVNSELDGQYDFLSNLDFVDDFSTDTTVLGFDRWPLDTTESGVGYNDGAVELQVSARAEDPDQGSSTSFDINRVTDSVSARVSLSSRSTIPAGEAEFSFDMEAVFYNDTMDGGFNDREGDMQAKLRLIQNGDGRMRLDADLQRRDADGNNNRLDLFDGQNRFEFVQEFDFLPQLDTIYEMGISLDREQGTMTYSVDDKIKTISLPTAAFEPVSRRVQIRAYHRGASGRSIARIHSIKIDGFEQDYTIAAPILAPYRPSYESQYRGVAISTTDDGRLRMSVDGRIAGNRNSRIVAQGKSDYIGATLTLSSESQIADNGKVFVGVSGLLYNSVTADAPDRIGNVFPALRLSSDGTGEVFVETCAFEQPTNDFNDSVELLGGDPENCPRLNFTAQLDTAYAAYVSLDRAAKTITFDFAGEQLVYNITTEVYETNQPFNGVRAQPTDDSMVVAYADDLAFSATAVSLAQSDFALGSDISDSTNGSEGTETETTSGDTGTSESSSSGGGCSITTGSRDPFMAWLLLTAIGGLVLRRRYKK